MIVVYRYDVDDEMRERIADYMLVHEGWKIRGKLATREQLVAYIEAAWENQWGEVLNHEHMVANALRTLVEAAYDE